ncbi:hypothetical protein [Bacillus cereus]|uniref:hypothetical protein n=1 Tax=Bacillus cereus TaxID=1396 RepID=UPI001879FE89|nr:hypothetical protein [Bacillus cereus]
MNVINFEQAKNRKIREQQMTTKIRIVERIYKVDGGVKFDVSGEKEFPKTLLEKDIPLE